MISYQLCSYGSPSYAVYHQRTNWLFRTLKNAVACCMAAQQSRLQWVFAKASGGNVLTPLLLQLNDCVAVQAAAAAASLQATMACFLRSPSTSSVSSNLFSNLASPGRQSTSHSGRRHTWQAAPTASTARSCTCKYCNTNTATCSIQCALHYVTLHCITYLALHSSPGNAWGLHPLGAHVSLMQY